MATHNQTGLQVDQKRLKELTGISQYALETLGDSLGTVWLKTMLENPTMSISKGLTLMGKESTTLQTDMNADFQAHLQGDSTITSGSFLEKFDPTFMTNKERADYYKNHGALLKAETKVLKEEADLTTESGKLMAEGLKNMEAVADYQRKMDFDVFWPISDLLLSTLDADTTALNKKISELPASTDPTTGPMTDPGENFWWFKNLWGTKDILPKYGKTKEEAQLNIDKAARVKNPRGTELETELTDLNQQFVETMQMMGTDLGDEIIEDPMQVAESMADVRRGIVNIIKELSTTLHIEPKQKYEIIGNKVEWQDDKETPQEARTRWYNEMVNNYQAALDKVKLKFTENVKQDPQQPLPGSNSSAEEIKLLKDEVGELREKLNEAEKNEYLRRQASQKPDPYSQYIVD